MVEQERARANAAAGLRSIIVMVDRLKHAQECEDPTSCALDDGDILQGLDLAGVPATEDERA